MLDKIALILAIIGGLNWGCIEMCIRDSSYRCGLLSCFNYFTSFLSLFHFLLLTFYSWSFRIYAE